MTLQSPHLRLSALAVLLAIGLGIAARPRAADEFDESRLREIDTVVNEAIKAGKLPGAVVLVGRGTETSYRKAFARSCRHASR